MIEKIKLDLKNLLENYYKNNYQLDISIVVEEPKKAELGDISIPMFSVVKTLRKPMPEIVSEATNIIKESDLPILEIKPVGAFVNLFVDKSLLAVNIIKEAIELDSNYGNSNIGEGQKFERIRRVTGYLSGDVSRFNNGKRAEEAARVKHSGVKEVMTETCNCGNKVSC